MYLPGRGGNLRLGLKRGSRTMWMQGAAQVTTRYRPGELLYEIRDPLLGTRAKLDLHVLATHETDGLVIRYSFVSNLKPPRDIELLVAFGGVNGERGVRDGDIGTERVPIREWFQLRPEFCRDNTIEISGGKFELRSAVARISGVLPSGARLSIADARDWSDPARLFDARGAS